MSLENLGPPFGRGSIRRCYARRMKSRLILGCLLGASLIQLISAACSSKDASTAPASADSDASPGSPSDAGPDFEVAAEVCDKTYEVEAGIGGPRPIFYSEHAYPGKTKFEIAAHVRHWTVITDPNKALRPTGYELNLQTALYTRDGFAGAGCEQGTTTYFIYH